MKSGKMIFTILLTLFIAFSFSGCTQSTEEPTDGNKGTKMEPVVLSFAHLFPASHPIHTDWVEGWAAAVEKATNGLVKVETYPGETLLGAAEIYDGIVEGSADIGLSCPEYNYGRFPVLEALIQPGILYQSDKVASNVAWEFTKEVNPEELQNTKVLTMLATGPGAIWSNEPIRTLEDLQGKEVRVTGVHVPFIKALGATPVAMPQSEAYEALQRGIVEANLGPTGMLKAYRQAEVADYVTITPFIYNCLYYTTINLDVWNSLTPEIQETIMDVTERMFDEVGAGLMDKDNEEGLRWAVEEQGMEVIYLTDEEQERWIKQLLPLQDEWVEKVGKMGLPGRELLDKVLNLAEEYDSKFH
jgi:TRAP-type C4-dicarboxylate transport system substrate-binding protein